MAAILSAPGIQTLMKTDCLAEYNLDMKLPIMGCVLLVLSFSAGALAAQAGQYDFPLWFEPNLGQAPAPVKAIAQSTDRRVFLSADAAILRARGNSLRMNFVGANPDADCVLLERLPSRTNYLMGSSESWKTDIPAFKRLEFRSVYPGIDVVYHNIDAPWDRRNGGADKPALEYDIVLTPGAKVSDIRIRFDTPELRRWGPRGEVLLQTGRVEWRHASPVVFQVRDGVRENVAGQLRFAGNDELTFELGQYDNTLPLIIDPVLTFSTYLGGSGYDNATGIALDPAGNVYVTGYTETVDFPVGQSLKLSSPTGINIFIAKLTATGQLQYLTYIGGADDDRACGVAVDSGGSATIVGWTYSSAFPLWNAAQAAPGGGRDGFVLKLNAAGNAVVFGTYLGGNGADAANGVRLDSQGNIYVAGETSSSNFPTINAFQLRSGGGLDAFVAKFTPAGARVYSSYLGGVAEDRATSIAADDTGNAYITGSTYSSNFPVAAAYQAKIAGGQDAFITKLSPSGQLVYSTYLGGSGGQLGAPESAAAIAVDVAGCAYVAGTTSSTNFPVVGSLQSAIRGGQDALVLKMNAAGNGLIYSTYLGGSGLEIATAIAIDASGRAYVTGYTGSTDFPTVSAMQSAKAGAYDTFVTTVNPQGTSMDLSTYLGGIESESANGIAVDAAGQIYLAGQTQSPDFPIASAVQSSAASTSSAFVARLGSNTAAVIVSPTPGAGLVGSSVTFQWSGGKAVTGYWLDVGTTFGGADIYSGYQGLATSRSVVNLPADGRNIYVRLWSQVNSVWSYLDCSYTAAQLAMSPAPGSMLSGSAVTFQWYAGAGVGGYWLNVATTLGGGDLCNAYLGLALSATVNNLPTDGRRIYVRLWWLTAGFWSYVDYVYTTAAPISPVPGTTFNSSTVTFRWATSGSSGYWLEIGTRLGGGEIYDAYLGSETTQTISNLPTHGGASIYVRLWSLVGGVWSYVDYVYKAAA